MEIGSCFFACLLIAKHFFSSFFFSPSFIAPPQCLLGFSKYSIASVLMHNILESLFLAFRAPCLYHHHVMRQNFYQWNDLAKSPPRLSYSSSLTTNWSNGLPSITQFANEPGYKPRQSGSSFFVIVQLLRPLRPHETPWLPKTPWTAGLHHARLPCPSLSSVKEEIYLKWL